MRVPHTYVPFSALTMSIAVMLASDAGASPQETPPVPAAANFFGAPRVPDPFGGPPPRVRITDREVDELLVRKFPNLGEASGPDGIRARAEVQASVRGNARGRLAEHVFGRINGHPEQGAFRPVPNPTAPQNDFWSTTLDEGVQVKTHRNVKQYRTSMIADDLAERFAVPDDHVHLVRQRWAAHAQRAAARGDHAAVAEAHRQIGRIVPIGRDFDWLDQRVASKPVKNLLSVAEARSGKAVQSVARILPKAGMAGVGSIVAGGAVVGGIEASIALMRYCNGTISQAELQDSMCMAGAQFTAGTVVSAVLVFATPAAPAVLVIAVGAGTAIAVEYVVESWLGSEAPSAETLASIAQPLPPLDVGAILQSGGRMNTALIRQPGHISIRELLGLGDLPMQSTEVAAGSLPTSEVHAGETANGR